MSPRDMVLQLSTRPQGVCNEDLQTACGIEPHAAANALQRAAKKFGLAKALVQLGQGAPRLYLFDTERAAQAWQGSSRAQAQARQQVQASAQARQAKRVQSLAAAGRLTVAKPRKATGTATLAATLPPLITSATKITIHQRQAPSGTRLDVMADPLPTVPGWRTGPVIRPGALDYKQHQRHHHTTGGAP